MKISGADTFNDNSHALPQTVTASDYQNMDHSLSAEIAAEGNVSDIDSDIDDSDLGEFLLDAFDSMEGQVNAFEQLETSM